MKQLVIAEPAARDLEGLVDYIALDNPVAAERVYRGIVSAAEKLPAFPALGRPVAITRQVFDLYRKSRYG